jgi:hypothetical protein
MEFIVFTLILFLNFEMDKIFYYYWFVPAQHKLCAQVSPFKSINKYYYFKVLSLNPGYKYQKDCSRI